MTDFVIVVEVDNKRAAAAYQKGLDDLDRIWDQLMLYAEQMDAPLNAVRDAELARLEDDERAFKAYLEDLKRWRTSSIWSSEPEPQMPAMPRMWSHFDFYSKDRYRNSYISVRAELQHLANVAGAAIGPYRMTEHQIREMVGWEDGSRIALMKEKML